MRKISKSKKRYSKPLLEVVTVDHEISLVMFSVVNPPEFGASPTAPESPESISPVVQQSNPFGGDSPDYSN